MHLPSILLGLCALPVAAFWRTGHLLVSTIAYNTISPQTQQSLDKMATSLNMVSPPVRGFAESSPWMDVVKDSGWHMVDSYHYQPNLLGGLKSAFAIMADARLPPWSFVKAFSTRYVAHAFGDLHQPLHVVADESKRKDLGGNLFPIRHPLFKNLHAFMDGGAGGWKEVSEVLTDADRAYIAATVKELMEEYPFKGPGEWNGTLEEWVKEGGVLAEEAYVGIEKYDVPSPEYVAKWQGILKKQVVKGGYRLAVKLL